MADPRRAGQGPTRRSELFASLATLDSPAAIEEALSGLIATGWVEVSAGLLRLTRDGERQHADLTPLVDDVRARVADALPQEEYVALVGLLERLVAAL